MRPRPFSRLWLVLSLAAGMWWLLPTESSGAAGWIAPLPEPLVVTRAFDPPEGPYGAGHRGVDLAGSPGQHVRAAGAGTVVYAGPLAGRGVVSVQHANGLRTTYEPVLASVAAGAEVGLGQVVGSLEAGHPGCPVSACLHWGLKRGELYLDPMLLLRQGPVRLLPRYGAGRPGSEFQPTVGMLAGSTSLGVLWLLPLLLRYRSVGGGREASARRAATATRRTALGFSAIKRVDGLAGRPP